MDSRVSDSQELVRLKEKGEVKYDTKFLWLLVINSSISSFILGYQNGAFNISQDAVVDYLGWGGERLLLVSIGTALVPVGGIFGGLSGGAADSLGRRKYLIIIDIVSIIGSVINWIPTTPTFMIGRFIGGFTGGAGCAICPMYNAEYSPPKMRGVLGNMFQVQVNIGILVAYWVSLPVIWLGNYWIIVIFAFPIVAVCVQMIIFMTRFKYEPPPWSLKKEKFDDARAAIGQVYFAEYADAKYEKALRSSQEHIEAGASVCQLLCRRKYRKEMFLGNFVAVFQNITGANLILFYSTTLFTQGGNSSLGPYLTLIVGAVNLVAVFPSIPLMKKSRRPVMIVGWFILFFFDLLIAIFSLFDLSYYAIIIFVMLWIVSYNLAPWPIAFTYLSEILSDKAMSVATAVNMLTSACVVASSGYFIEDLGLPITFFMYGGFNLWAVLFNSIFVVETNDRDKADIRLKSFHYN